MAIGTGLVWGTNFSGFCGAVQLAQEGPNVTWAGPSLIPGEMWGSGLFQTDREDTLMIRPNDHVRWGVLRDMEVRFGTYAGGGPLLFPTKEAFFSCLFDVLKLYSTRGTFAGETVEHGQITLMMGVDLDAVNVEKVYDATIKDYLYPCRSVVLSGTTYPFDAYMDATDELDLARKLKCKMTMGREGKAQSGEPTAGVRSPTVQGRMSLDPITGKQQAPLGHSATTGQRRKGVFPPRALALGDPDTQPMSYCERVLVTTHPNRVNWADLPITVNPADYDVDYEIAKGQNLGDIPGSISNAPMRPEGTFPQLDMNNGGGGRIGMNFIGGFNEWFNATWIKRQEMLYRYNAYKFGLFKDISTGQRWKDLPRRIVRDKDGNITSNTHIVEETVKYGLIPGIYRETMWVAAETLTVGTVRWNGFNLYRVTRAGTTAASGGPTGTSSDILDGDATNGVKWTFVSPYYSPEIPWLPNQAVPVRTIRFNGNSMYRVIAAGVTAASGGPTGTGTSITDGTAKWAYMGPYVPDAMPHIYVREGPHAVAQGYLKFTDTVAPEVNIAEPMTAAGYAHTDGHHISRTGDAAGNILFEGFGGLDNGEENILVMVPMKVLMARLRDCPNLVFARGMGGSRLGCITLRIELSWAKCAQSAAFIMAVALIKGKYTGRVTYNEVLPYLLKRGSFISYT